MDAYMHIHIYTHAYTCIYTHYIVIMFISCTDKKQLTVSVRTSTAASTSGCLLSSTGSNPTVALIEGCVVFWWLSCHQWCPNLCVSLVHLWWFISLLRVLGQLPWSEGYCHATWGAESFSGWWVDDLLSVPSATSYRQRKVMGFAGEDWDKTKRGYNPRAIQPQAMLMLPRKQTNHETNYQPIIVSNMGILPTQILTSASWEYCE